VLNWALSHPAEASKIAEAGYAHVKANHTYEVRCRWLLDQLKTLV